MKSPTNIYTKKQIVEKKRTWNQQVFPDNYKGKANIGYSIYKLDQTIIWQHCTVLLHVFSAGWINTVFSLQIIFLNNNTVFRDYLKMQYFLPFLFVLSRASQEVRLFFFRFRYLVTIAVSSWVIYFQQLVRKNMDVNENEKLPNLTKIKVKEQHFYLFYIS